MKEKLSKLFEAIDKKDADGFASFLTDNASFRFANADAVSGRGNAKKAVSGFFSNIKRLKHNITGSWELADTLICEGEVTYTRQDDSQITLSFVNVLRLENDLISDYRIYMDISPLWK